MSVGSISSSSVAARYGAPQGAGEHAATERAATGQAAGAAGTRSVAEHVAAADDSEPIRSVAATQGTLVDTYL